MSFNIGVTGHRDIVVTKKLRTEIENYLETLIYTHRDEEIYLLSPLAEGADRLVAEIFLAFQSYYPNLYLIVPIPFEQRRYMEDFDRASKHEFWTYTRQAKRLFCVEDTQGDGYRSVGVFVADRSDILLALWDGTDNHKAGGTADIVKYAKAQGKEVKHFLTQRQGG